MAPTESPSDAPQPLPAQEGWWIGIETSGFYGSVALAEVRSDACRGVATLQLPRDARSAQTLAPTLKKLLEQQDCPPASVAAVAVAVGPGSFTGLRVGVTTAKAFAWAVGAAVVAVDTLDALADAAPRPPAGGTALWTLLDAQRGELFTARFAAEGESWRRDGKTLRHAAADFAGLVQPGDLVVGPPAAAWGGTPLEPPADAVLRVAHRRWMEGAAGDVFALAPQYHRASAAEEKLAQSNGEPSA